MKPKKAEPKAVWLSVRDGDGIPHESNGLRLTKRRLPLSPNCGWTVHRYVPYTIGTEAALGLFEQAIKELRANEHENGCEFDGCTSACIAGTKALSKITRIRKGKK